MKLHKCFIICRVLFFIALWNDSALHCAPCTVCGTGGVHTEVDSDWGCGWFLDTFTDACTDAWRHTLQTAMWIWMQIWIRTKGDIAQLFYWAIFANCQGWLHNEGDLLGRRGGGGHITGGPLKCICQGCYNGTIAAIILCLPSRPTKSLCLSVATMLKQWTL